MCDVCVTMAMERKYIGIRYATAPRLGMPIPEPDLASVDEVRTKTVISPQSPTRLDELTGLSVSGQEQGEDCLRLAVFTPGTEGKKPVMIFVHGGAFMAGSGLLPIYDASSLSEETDAVVVTVSYRLGCFGFLCMPDRGVVNLGVEDIACAIRWVRRNVHLFGGDADNITVAGHSSGAYCVAQIIAQEKEPLFRRVYLMSSPLASKTSVGEGRKVTDRFLELLGKDPAEADVDEMMRAQDALVAERGPRPPFNVVGRSLLKTDHVMPGIETALLTTCKQDAMPFAPTKVPLVTRVMTWLMFRRPMEAYGRVMTRNGIKVLYLEYDWFQGEAPYGATHCVDMPVLFGEWEGVREVPMLKGVRMDTFEVTQMRTRRLLRNLLKGKL